MKKYHVIHSGTSAIIASSFKDYGKAKEFAETLLRNKRYIGEVYILEVIKGFKAKSPELEEMLEDEVEDRGGD